MLGWKVLEDGEYNIGLQHLSDDETQLVSLVDEKFKEIVRSRKLSSDSEARELLRSILLACAGDQELYLSESQKGYLSEIIFYQVYGFGFLSRLLEDPAIEEISIIGVGIPAYVFLRDVGWKRVDACFTRSEAIFDTINRMASKIGRRITLQNPRINAVLPDGSRLHASLPPVSAGELTIRKFRDIPFSPKELLLNGTLSSEALALISLIMQGDFSVVVAGNTASGKTTTLNTLFSFVPVTERVLITEETPEISIPHPHQLRLVSNSEMGITLKDLVYDSLRMRPDRLIVGEIRNREEAEALMDVLLGGQARGSYATFHAQSSREAVGRFKSFGISGQDITAIDLIIMQRRMLFYDNKKRRTYEARKIIEVSEISDSGSFPVFSLSSSGSLVFNRNSKILERVSQDLGLSNSEVKQELKRRIGFFGKSNVAFKKFISSVQKDFFGVNYASD